MTTLHMQLASAIHPTRNCSQKSLFVVHLYDAPGWCDKTSTPKLAFGELGSRNQIRRSTLTRAVGDWLTIAPEKDTAQGGPRMGKDGYSEVGVSPGPISC